MSAPPVAGPLSCEVQIRVFCFPGRPAARSPQDANCASRPRGVGEAPVGGQQLAAQNLSEGHIDRVVHCHVRTQLICTAHEPQGRIAVQI